MEVEDRKGLLAAVSAKIADINTNIKNMEARTDDGPARAHRHDGRDQRPEAPREGDQVAARRRRRAWTWRRAGRAGKLVAEYVDGGSHELPRQSDLRTRTTRSRRFRRARPSAAARPARSRARDTARRSTCRRPRSSPRSRSCRRGRPSCGRRRRTSRPPASSSAPMLSSTRRVCAAMSPSTMLAGRRIERNLARDEQQLPGANRRRIGADRLRRVGLEMAVSCARH